MFKTTVVDETEVAELSVEMVEGQKLSLEELDRRPGAVAIESVSLPEFDESVSFSWDFDEFRDARMAYGLWQSCGPFPFYSTDRAVPIEVAAAGKPAIGGYLYLHFRSRRKVADELGISTATVSNYLSQLRWEIRD